MRTNGGTVQDSFAYDALGRTKSTTRNGLGTISYQYDAAGDRTRLTWPDGFYVGYSYDVTGKMTSVLETAVTTPDYHAIATYKYDSLGRLTSSGRASQATLGYTYDNVSRLSQMSYTYPNSASNTSLGFQYDEANQITWRQFTNNGYDWEPSVGDTHITYGLDALNRVTSAGGGNFSYDAKGDLTSDSVNTYSYNGHNWMVGANGASLVYDALGRVASVTSSGSTTQFLYDGSDLIAEYDGSGNLLRRHIHGDGGDDIVGWYEGSTRRYLLPDNQGSIIGVIDQSGNLIQANTYDESGVPGGSNLGRFQYTGQAFMPEIGLYNFKARMYAPSLGRFMQTDPSGYNDGMNWYNYAHGNAVNGTDPTGLGCPDVTPYCQPSKNGPPPSSTVPEVIVTAPYSPPTSPGYNDPQSSQSQSAPSSGPGAGAPQHNQPQNIVAEVVVTAKRRSQGIDLSKLGSCLGGSALDYYGLTGAAGASGLLAIPIPKSIVPPFRSIGTPTTNLFSVVGHYVDISVPAVTIAGRTSTNLFRIAGRLNPYVAAGLFAVDAAAIGYDTYQCYNGQ